MEFVEKGPLSGAHKKYNKCSSLIHHHVIPNMYKYLFLKNKQKSYFK